MAGVSTATVSKVLSNTPYFSDAAREKVMQAVEALGYTPNLAARALSSGKTHIVGVVFPYIYDAIFKDPLVMQIIEGIEAECSARGYNLLLSTPRLSDDGPDANFRQLIRSGYMDGMIAIDNVPLTSVAAAATQHNIPTVVIGYAQADYAVRGDDEAGGRQLMQHILGLGHRNIGMITVPGHLNHALAARLRGVDQALAAANITLEPTRTAFSDYSTSSGAAAVEQLITTHPDITAIVCMNDRTAIGAMQRLQAMGRRVPEDVSVVGYDNISIAAVMSPPLTTIDQQASALGQHAAQMLFEVLDGKTPESLVLPVQLVQRRSSAPAQDA